MNSRVLYDYDLSLGERAVCGVDEAGRGPLAGPVSVCAYVARDFVDGVNDSKKLSEIKREKLFDVLVRSAACYKVVLIDAQEIDDVNILRATLNAMKSAVEGLSEVPSLVLCDGNTLPDIANARTIVKGDAISYAIAAASIIAKVTRDRLMRVFDTAYPEYGFAKHKGYGTADHIAAIKKYGACPIHRRTFITRIVGGAL